jgi:hypothetical protein
LGETSFEKIVFEANGLVCFSEPFSRFSLYTVPLQSGLNRICIECLSTVKKTFACKNRKTNELQKTSKKEL